MKRWILICLAILVAFTFYGCNSKADTADIHFFRDLKSYEATVTVNFFKDKEPNTIQIRQVAHMNGTYEMTVLAPKHLEGVTIKCDGQKVTEYYPSIDKEIEAPFNPVQNETLLTTLVKRFLENDTTSKEETTLNGQKATTYEIPINSNIKYFSKEKIWLNEEKLMPLQVIIYDNEGNIVIEMIYNTFKINV